MLKKRSAIKRDSVENKKMNPWIKKCACLLKDQNPFSPQRNNFLLCFNCVFNLFKPAIADMNLVSACIFSSEIKRA